MAKSNVELKARDLAAAGWAEGPWLGAALRRGRELERMGVARDEVLVALEREFPKQVERILPRTEPAPGTEAIEAGNPLEERNLAQVRERMRELLHTPVVKRGTLMPDACPSGAGRALIPVGGGIEVENAIIPGAHSSDICCSLFATFFAPNQPVTATMDHLVQATHFGAGGRPRPRRLSSAVLEQPVWDNPFLAGQRERAHDFLGTQGDGNHFAYLGRITFTEAQAAALRRAGYVELAETIARREGDFSVLVTHHGSRGLGAELYRRGQAAARKWCDENARDIPDYAAWLPADSAEGRAYWDALQYISRWTRENHVVIHDALMRRIGQRPLAQVGNEHNFIWKRGDSYYHGKGATPAWRDSEGRPLLGLIPLNMAREILFVLGGDNDQYLSFCPHGAGRDQSRTAMLAPYRDADGELDPGKVRDVLAAATPGLDIRWYCGAPDLSESPLGYKDATRVKEQISRFELAEVVGEIQPQGSIMAGEPPEPPWARARRAKRAAHKAMRGEARSETRIPDDAGP